MPTSTLTGMSKPSTRSTSKDETKSPATDPETPEEPHKVPSPTASSQEDPKQDHSSESESSTSSADVEDEEDYKFWDGTYGPSNGNFAKLLKENAGSDAQQRRQAVRMYTFLTSDSATKFCSLNRSTHPNPIVICLPNSFGLRILFHPEALFSSELHLHSPCSFRTMQGEMIHATSSAPTNTMILPADAFDAKMMQIPSADHAHKVFDEIDDVNGLTWPLFKSSELTGNRKQNVPIMHAAPVPLFTVIDHIDRDMNALILMERLATLPNANEDESIAHALNFLLASLTKYGPTCKKQPAFTQASFWFCSPSRGDMKWAEEKIRQCYPNKPSPRPYPYPPAQTNFSEETVQKLLSTILNARLEERPTPATTTAAAPTTAPEEDESSTWTKKLGLSKRGIEERLRFCGLSQGQESDLPPYIAELAEKSLTRPEKEGIIRDHVERYKFYQTHQVNMVPAVMKAIVDHNWAGTSELQVHYSNCMKGVSLFLFRDYSEAHRYTMEEEANALDHASSTTVRDHVAKLGKPYVPQDWRDLEDQLCQFANTYHSLSNGGNPVSKCVRDILHILTNEWTKAARAKLTIEHFAIIMWIVVVQTRYFLLDARAKLRTTAPAMLNLLDDLRSGRLPGNYSIMSTELLASIKSNPEDRKRKGSPNDEEPERKTPKLTPTDEEGGKGPGKGKGHKFGHDVKVNPIITAALGPALKRAQEKKMSITTLCIKVGAPPPKGLMKGNRCANGALYGKCSVRNCKRDHSPLPDEEAKEIVEQFKPLKENPDGVLEG